MDNLILSHQKNSVLYIQFNRPDKKNALTNCMYLQLCDLLNMATERNDIHVVALYGTNSCFTGGNDLHDFINCANDEELAAIKFVKVLTKFEKPLVAGVAGPAVGIGTTLLLHCDYVAAAPNTLFKLPFTQLGLCPEAASSLLLPKLVGHAKAFELLVMGESFSESEANSFGLINSVVPSDELIAHIQLKAQQIASLPSKAVLASKQLMKSSNQHQISESANLEFEKFLALLKSDDCQNIINQLVRK